MTTYISVGLPLHQACSIFRYYRISRYIFHIDNRIVPFFKYRNIGQADNAENIAIFSTAELFLMLELSFKICNSAAKYSLLSRRTRQKGSLSCTATSEETRFSAKLTHEGKLHDRNRFAAWLANSAVYSRAVCRAWTVCATYPVNATQGQGSGAAIHNYKMRKNESIYALRLHVWIKY